MTTTRVPISACKACGKPNDSATSISADIKPTPGDVSICLYCGHVTVFDDDLTLREPTSKEMHEIAANKIMLAAQKARKP